MHRNKSISPRRIAQAAAALVCACTLSAQTQLDLSRQARKVDFSAAASTKPSRVGASLPSSCSQGETYFLTSASPGSNLYTCSSANTWSAPGLSPSGVAPGAYGSSTQVPVLTLNSQGIVTGAFTVPVSGGGGGGATQSTDLIDCKLSVSGSTATVPAPCRVVIGSTVHTLAGNAVATLGGTSASGTAYFYWDSAGNLRADQSTPATFTCNSNCTPATTGGFPISGFPIATATFVNNSFTSGVVTDLRSTYSAQGVMCGLNLTCTALASGAVQLDASSSVVTTSVLRGGQKVACLGSAAGSPDTCSFGAEPLTGYLDHMVLQYSPGFTNAGAFSINVDGLGAVPVKTTTGADPAPGASVTGIQYPVTYSASANVFYMPASSAAAATYSPVTFYPAAQYLPGVAATSSPWFSYTNGALSGSIAEFPALSATYVPIAVGSTGTFDFRTPLPDWNGSNPVKFQLAFFPDDATSGHTVNFSVQLGCAVAGAAALTFSSAQTLTATLSGTNKLVYSPYATLPTAGCSAPGRWVFRFAVLNSGTATGNVFLLGANVAR